MSKSDFQQSVLRFVALIVLCFAQSERLLAEDWNQFRGPNRDNLSTETGLLNQWPAGGPKLLFTATGLGEGY